MSKNTSGVQESWPTVNRELTNSWKQTGIALLATPACLYPASTSLSLGIAAAIIAIGYAPSVGRLGKLKSAFQEYANKSRAHINKQMLGSAIYHMKNEELAKIKSDLRTLDSTNKHVQDIKLSAENTAAAILPTGAFALEEQFIGAYESIHETALKLPFLHNIVPDYNAAQKYLTAFLLITLWMHLKGIEKSGKDIKAAYDKEFTIDLDKLEPPEQ
jgi:hypothetical protein